MPVAFVIIGIVVALMFPITWKLLGYLLIASIHILKWTIVIALLTGLLCCPQMYEYIGFTPISLIFGKEIYEHSPPTKIVAVPPRRMYKPAMKRPGLNGH